MSLLYKSGYKYQLAHEHTTATRIHGWSARVPGYVYLWPDGHLWIGPGYAWDGPSGPTLDTPSFMQASLVHDVLYQLIREGYLPSTLRELADTELRRYCLENGMSRLRAWYTWRAVRVFGQRALAQREILSAPTALV